MKEPTQSIMNPKGVAAKRGKEVHFSHTAFCSTCGKYGFVDIGAKTGKILDENWGHWGRINVNAEHTEPYFYLWCEGGAKNKKEYNSSYDPKAPELWVEYWECGKCMKKADERVKKRLTPKRGSVKE